MPASSISFGVRILLRAPSWYCACSHRCATPEDRARCSGGGHGLLAAAAAAEGTSRRRKWQTLFTLAEREVEREYLPCCCCCCSSTRPSLLNRRAARWLTTDRLVWLARKRASRCPSVVQWAMSKRKLCNAGEEKVKEEMKLFQRKVSSSRLVAFSAASLPLPLPLRPAPCQLQTSDDETGSLFFSSLLVEGEEEGENHSPKNKRKHF